MAPIERMTLVEAGTEQAADVGYGDDGYIAALGELPDEARTHRRWRFGGPFQLVSAIRGRLTCYPLAHGTCRRTL